jgi:methionyl-tRNA formyltransferase
MPYARQLAELITQQANDVALIHNHQDIQKGDVLILLSCEQILKDLSLNKYNLVAHASDLPQGKGWSPMTWQILEGKNEIPLTLFEAAEKVDAGVIYYQEFVKMEGHELLDELREKLGNAIIKLILQFIENYDHIQGTPQEGESTYYKKRKPENSELDISKTIEEQFNLFRVCDNERYPAFFYKDGVQYILKIEKA